MNLIKLENLDIIPLDEVRIRLNEKNEKIVVKKEINEIGEKVNINEFESNLVNNVFLTL